MPITTTKQSNRSRIQVKKTGQIIVTIPRALAQAMDLKRYDDVEWIITDKGLLIRKINLNKNVYASRE